MTKRAHRVRTHTRRTKYGRTTVRAHTRGSGSKGVEAPKRNLEQVKRWPRYKTVGGERFEFWGVYQTHSAASKEKQNLSKFAMGSISSSDTDKWHPEKGSAWVRGRGSFALYTKHRK